METVTISFARYKELLLSHIWHGESFDSGYWESVEAIEKAATFEELQHIVSTLQ